MVTPNFVVYCPTGVVRFVVSLTWLRLSTLGAAWAGPAATSDPSIPSRAAAVRIRLRMKRIVVPPCESPQWTVPVQPRRGAVRGTSLSKDVELSARVGGATEGNGGRGKHVRGKTRLQLGRIDAVAVSVVPHAGATLMSLLA